MRAFRVGSEGLTPVREYLGHCRLLGGIPRRVLLDARVEGTYGGTGQVADWDTLRGYHADKDSPPMVLAGA